MRNTNEFKIIDGVLIKYNGTSNNVVIPDGVTSIGEKAFQNCESLTSIAIPNGVTSIGNYAFIGCLGLKSITIPDSVTNIGEGAFAYCRNLMSITIPDGVTSIGNYAFKDCESLTSITIPDSVTSIGQGAFRNCDRLMNIVVAEGNPVYHSNGSCLIESASKTLIAGCYTSVIPADGSVTHIGEEAFYGCENLTGIAIPNGVTSIGEQAFAYCRKLTSIAIPNGVTSIGDSAFRDCDNLTKVIIPDSVTGIGKEAFAYCHKLTSITIPDSVISIGNYAFENCESLTSITIPNSVTSIGYSAFWNCHNLTSITIPDGIANIDGTFKGCRSLTSITIPDSVTNIGEGAFAYCRKLTSITIPDGVTNIGDWAFSGCESLTSITIPDRVTSIGDWAFKDCESLASITIPDNVTSIGEGAFWGCKALKNVTLPSVLAKGLNNYMTDSDNIIFHIDDISNVTAKFRLGAVLGFAEDERDGSDENGKKYLKYIKSNADRLAPYVVTHPALFYLMLREKLITAKNLETVTKIVQDSGNFEMIAAILDYGNSSVSEKDKARVQQKKTNLTMESVDPYSNLDDHELEYKVLDKKNWKKLSTDEQVNLFFARQAKSLMDAYFNCVSDAEKFGAAILEHLSAKPSVRECNAVANFMTLFLWDVSTELLRQMYETIKPFKTAQKALKRIEDNPRLNELLGISAPSEKELLPIEQKLMKILQQQRMLVTEPEDRLKEHYGLTADDIPAVKCKDGTIVPPMVMAWLLMVPNEEYSFIDEKPGRWGKLQALDCNTKEIVAELDYASLQDCLRTLAANNLGKYVYGKKLKLTYPICYYADETLMAELTKAAPSWRSNTSGNDAPPFYTFLRACMYSNTRAAIFFLERYGDKYFVNLRSYAAMHDTTEDAIRDKFMSDVGLDENGGKSYDLGNQVVTARLQADLSYLIELPNGKFAKSLPKKGADETKYATANADFLEMKKSTKKIIKNRCDNLFKDFLSGRVRDAEDWCASYLHNPLLSFVAELLVWCQGGNTFTLKDGQLIDSAEQPYTIGNKPISVAHPMDMEMTEVKTWQKYFISHGLKQPFAQMWEPVINPAVIKEDRYKGLMIPYFRFMNQEKHGITVDDYEYHNDIRISFYECQTTVERIDFERHEIKPNHRFEVKKFGFRKYTRQVNHIVGLLDKWTVYGRILNDDISITEQLPQFTLAQITDFIKLASENNCTNCMAALLEYKNANFADFDPMMEFTLE